MIFIRGKLIHLFFVSVSGQWGEWGAWSECNAECGRGTRRRSRRCDDPPPTDGGPGCEGPAADRKPCVSVCPAVDGGWSGWSGWTSCTPDCRRFRRRECTAPKPRNGGRYCEGGSDSDTGSQNCTGGLCKREIYFEMIFGKTED